MKQLILSVFLLIFCAGTVFGQSTDSDNATVSVIIVQSMSVDAEQNLNFGTVVLGTPSKTVDSDDFANAARFRIGAASGYDIEILLNAPAQLNNGAEFVTFNNNQDPVTTVDQAGNGAVTRGGWAAANGGTLQTAGGEIYLWIGGTVTLTGSEAPGVYSGTYQVTATYDGL